MPKNLVSSSILILKKTKFILNHREEIEFNDTIEFGKNGKPFYFSGPYDSKEKTKRIYLKLVENVGEGNFDFIIPEREY